MKYVNTTTLQYYLRISTQISGIDSKCYGETNERKMKTLSSWEKLWGEAGFEMFDKVGSEDGVELPSMNRKLVYPALCRLHVLGLFSKLLWKAQFIFRYFIIGLLWIVLKGIIVNFQFIVLQQVFNI